MKTIILRKKGSPHAVNIKVDPKDSHFCNIEVMKLKDGAVARSHYILKSDVQTWLSMYARDGFVPVEMKEANK